MCLLTTRVENAGLETEGGGWGCQGLSVLSRQVRKHCEASHKRRARRAPQLSPTGHLQLIMNLCFQG